MSIDFEQEATELTATQEQLDGLSALVKMMVQQEQEVDELGAKLKTAQQRLRQLQEVDVPTKMDELGFPFLGLPDGRKVEVAEVMHASIPKKNKPQCAQWLEEHGHGALVSETVTTSFGKGQQEEVEKVIALLAENGYKVKAEENMNTTTVKALFKELMEGGEADLPFEMFGIHLRRVAKVG